MHVLTTKGWVDHESSSEWFCSLIIWFSREASALLISSQQSITLTTPPRIRRASTQVSTLSSLLFTHSRIPFCFASILWLWNILLIDPLSSEVSPSFSSSSKVFRWINTRNTHTTSMALNLGYSNDMFSTKKMADIFLYRNRSTQVMWKSVIFPPEEIPLTRVNKPSNFLNICYSPPVRSV